MMHRSRRIPSVGFQSFSVNLLSTRVIVGVLFCASPVIGQDSETPHIVHDGGPDPLTTPCTGYVDPRLEVNSIPPFGPAGVQEAFVKFSTDVFKADGVSDVDKSSFTLTECLGGPPPPINLVEYVGGDRSYVHVQWDWPIRLKEWTTLRAEVYNAEGVPIENLGDLGPGVKEPDRLDFAALPGDIDQSGRVEVLDLLRFRQFLQDTCGSSCPTCGGALLYFDTDHNSSIEPEDFLRFRVLLIGGPPGGVAWLLRQLWCPQP